MPVQQPNVKISEVNTKQYQKPKKVAVNEADKYNLNVQDYDIYENQVWIYILCNNRLNKIVKIVLSLMFHMHVKIISLCYVSGSAEQEQIPHFRWSTI